MKTNNFRKNQRSASKRTIIIIVAGLLLVSALTLAYLYFNRPNNSKAINNQKTLIKTDDNKTTDGKSTNVDTKTQPVNNEQSPNTTPDDQVSATITAANQNGSMLQIRTLIQAVTTDGTCSLKLTGPNGSVVTKSAGIQSLASASTCAGFNVPVSELSPGSWQIELEISIPSKKATLTKTIIITA
jgi:hypothetical protein